MKESLLAMFSGFALTETAITRVCPLNELFGIDSRSSREIMFEKEPGLRDWERIQPQEEIAESIV